MDDQEREDLTQQSNRLRVELKVWEKDFSTANNGNKASREDIKNNPEIGMIGGVQILGFYVDEPA